MKKFFSALTALLLLICFISCMADEISDSANSQKEGSVILSIKKARTISPADGISYKNVQEWKVTFKDKRDTSEKYNDIVKYVRFTEENPTSTVQLPLGEFYVIFEGTAESSTLGETATTQLIPYYGESTVTVTAETAASVSVFVAPKKTGNGKGSFNFTVNISGLENLDIGSPVFETNLIPYAQGTANPTLKSDVLERTENGTYKLTITGSDIRSGFYQLSIKYIWETYDSEQNKITKDKEIYYPYYDFLVEIVDGLTTSGSADITVSLDDSKTYYATTDKTKGNGNGSFISMPGYFDDVLTAINKTTISTANIIMVDKLDLQNPSYPEIDVSKVNEAGKTYQIFTSSDVEQIPFYRISGAGEGCNPTINIHSSVTTVTLKNSLSSSGISGVANIVVAGRPNFVLEDNTSVIIDLTDSQQILATTIYMPDSTYNKYYAEHPCVTVKNTTGSQTEFDVNLGDDALNNSCIVVSNSSSDETYKTTKFYIIPSYATGVSTTGIPNYSLAVTKGGVPVTDNTKFYAGDTVEIKATPNGDTFANGTTFAWFVNGEQVEANEVDPKSCTVQFGVTGNSGVNNSIICLAGYNGEYATVQTTLTAAEQTALLYTERGLGYAELASLNGNPNLSWILSSLDYTISDFCIDTKTNDAYIIYSNSNEQTGFGTYIEKATYYHVCTERYAPVDFKTSAFASSLIKMGNDNNLYVKLDAGDNLLGIVTLSSGETENTASFKYLSNPNEWSSEDLTSIMSFCIDAGGIIYVTYKDNQSGDINLASFTNTNDSLSKSNSITLATISSTNDTVTTEYLPSNISSNITITDMHYEDGYIYLLVRDVFIDYSIPTDKVRSLGGVCKIKASDLTLADSSNPLIGWANTKLDMKQNESVANVYNYKHNEEVQNYFYGPQKIIAIKPKEIVIADDGASIENSKMYQKNRVVLFNLETNSITDVKTSPTEFYFSTSGGDNTAYQPN